MNASPSLNRDLAISSARSTSASSTIHPITPPDKMQAEKMDLDQSGELLLHCSTQDED